MVWAGRLMPPWPVVFAAIRAVLQLASVSALITAVLVSLVLTGAFLLLMAVVATATSAARTGVGRRSARVGLAITAGVIPALALRLGTGLLPATGIALVPMGGILIGGGMTATTLSVRRVLDTAPADNLVRAAQAACGHSWRTPPSRSCRRMSRWAIRSGSVMGTGTGRSGAA